MVRSMHILLTNDDSFSSPLMGFTAQRLAAYGQVTIVVPQEEQSWQGKSMSRFRLTKARTTEVAGWSVQVLNGTPCDCVNIGINHLCASPPDLVVAGMNVGQNVGLSYLWSSGTVAAGLEANICGVPALALSQALNQEAFNSYRHSRRLPPDFLNYVETCTAPLLEMVLNLLLVQHRELLQPDLVWNVNFPAEFNPAKKPRLCRVGHTLYGSLFRREGDGFINDARQVLRDSSPDCDSHLLNSGHATLTPISFTCLGAGSEKGLRDSQALLDLAAVQTGRFSR